jgi:hypothetical protein
LISVLLHVATMITTRPCLLQVTPAQFAEPDAGHGFVFGSQVVAWDQLGKDARAFMVVRSVPVTWALAGGVVRNRVQISKRAVAAARNTVLMEKSIFYEPRATKNGLDGQKLVLVLEWEQAVCELSSRHLHFW